MANGVKLDEIGSWSEVKLDILRRYATEYSKIMAGQKAKVPAFRHWYIDGFAGAGSHISRESGDEIPGSPKIALSVEPPFDGYMFVDMDPTRAAGLRELDGWNGRRVTVEEGDCNEVLLKVLPQVRYDKYRRALCVLDPYNLNPDWDIVRVAGELGTVEIFLNFMVMDLKMNIHLGDASRVAPGQVDRMNRFWGDESWREVGYAPDPQMNLFEEPGVVKRESFALVDAYRKRLKDVAGFKYVPEPIPMKNSTGAEIYYLFFASPNATANRIVEDIFAKYRREPLPDRIRAKGKRGAGGAHG